MKNILIIVILLAVAGGVWWYFSNSSEDTGEVCAQVITEARNPETGEVKEFPTPCDVPEGWEVTSGEVMDSYSSEKLGLSFSYPSEPEEYVVVEHRIDEIPHNQVVAHVSLFNKSDYEELQASTEPREGPPAITFLTFKNPEGLSARAWAEDNAFISNIKMARGGVSDTTLQGKSGVHFMGDGLYANETYIVRNGEYIHYISGAYSTEESQIREDFSKILETIAFR